MIKVKLTKPLDGLPIGAFTEFDESDAMRLAALGAVEIADEKAAIKAAPKPRNKMATPPLNKASDATDASAEA